MCIHTAELCGTVQVREGAKTVTGYSSTSRFFNNLLSVFSFIRLLLQLLATETLLKLFKEILLRNNFIDTVHVNSFLFVSLGASMFPSLTPVARAACLLGLGQLDHRKVGASPLASVIRSRHSDGQIGHYPALQALNRPALQWKYSCGHLSNF